MAPYDQFILFGDSIIQQSCNQEHGFGFMSALQNAFIRRLDVINRGFSGYNTSQALDVFPKFMPKPEQATVRYLVIFFGANDACLRTSPTGQHVPVEEYGANIHKLLEMAREAAPKARIILISPPPVNEYQLEVADRERFGVSDPIPRRTAEHTRRYADRCARIMMETKLENVAFYDVWKEMMTEARWTLGDRLAGSLDRDNNVHLNHWLSDGLHLRPPGYLLLFKGLMGVIKETWPDSNPEDEAFVFPRYEEAPKG